MSKDSLFDEVAQWVLQQDSFVTSLRICDHFNIKLVEGYTLARKLLTHPRIDAEYRRDKCLTSGGRCSIMLMVKVTKITPIPFGPPKPKVIAKPPVPCKPPKPVKETLHQRLRRLADKMPSK